MSAPEPVVVCVVGMHRSGTSLLARLLNLAGVELGEGESLAAAAEDNPRGFWEHKGLRELNDELLAIFGGSWMHPPDLPAGWTADPRVAPVRAKARALLAREFGGRALWGFKDPRTTLTAEFWAAELPGRVAWIIALRNPLEVADSLKRRNGFPSVLSEDLWHAYVRAALRLTPPESRALVHFENLLSNPSVEVERLVRELRLPAAPMTPEVAARMREECSRELRHHQHGLEEVSSSRHLRPDTIGLYLRLWNGGDPGQLAGESDAGFGRAFVDLRGDFARLIDQQDRMRNTLDDRQRDLERSRREAAEWREEALQLKGQVASMRLRTEVRAGDFLRRAWRRLRRRAPRA